MAHEAEISVPGSFVVLQGSPGDGMSNTIDSLPLLPEFLDDPPDAGAGNMGRSADHLDEGQRRTQHPGSTLFSPSQSNMSQQQRNDEGSLREWRAECRSQERQQRQDWKNSFESQYYRQQEGEGGSVSTNSMIESQNDRDAMWWQIDGRLALLRELPTRLPSGVVVRTSLGTLSPGSTLVATDIIHLHSSSLKRVARSPTHTSYSNGNPQQSIYPSGRQGLVQMLKIVSSGPGQMTAYVTLNVDGYPLMAPGLPSLYVNPNVWIWRVTCPVGAYVRLGLELNTQHVDTIPYGSLVRVTRKTVNDHGLARLRVQSVVDDTSNRNRAARMVDGWCSEFLNPLSGQRGSVARPLSFPVPAVYKVRLREGAVIRRDVELSSPQIGHAPHGAEISIIGRAFSEHPMDRCIERLQLAGNGGWISVRLNRPPPEDELVVDFVGLDSSFDPTKPGHFHLETQRQVEGYIREALEASGEVASTDVPDISRLQINENIEGNGASHANATAAAAHDESTLVTEGDESLVSERPQPSMSLNSSVARTRNATVQQRRQKMRCTPTKNDDDRCLICLTEERNATIVHGETGHVACCLVCARILKARGDKCPVCRFEIDLIIQHFWA